MALDRDPPKEEFEIHPIKPDPLNNKYVPLYARDWCLEHCDDYGGCDWLRSNCPYYNTPQWMRKEEETK